MGRWRGRLGCRAVVVTWVVTLGAICPPAAWAQNTDVTLDFQFPPDFEANNPPANVDDSQSDLLTNGGVIEVSSVLAGSRDESPATDEEGGHVTTAAGAFSVGFDATIVRNLQLFTIPLFYHVTPALPLGLIVPVIHRTGDHGEVYGIGDVAASAGYRWGSPLTVLGITTAYIKAPTGDAKEQDSGEFLPLGSGSWDFALYQTLIKRFGYSRGELTVGYRLNTAADFNVDANFDGANDRVHLRYGDTLNVILGLDREIRQVPGLIGSLQVDSRWIRSTHLKIRDGATATHTAHRTGDVILVDVLPRVKYFVAPGTPLTLGLRIPVDHLDGRDVAFDFGIHYVF